MCVIIFIVFMERKETLTFPWQILERHIYDVYCYVISKMVLLLLCIDFLSITMQYALMRYMDCNMWNKDFHFLCWSILRYLSLSFLTETHLYPQHNSGLVLAVNVWGYLYQGNWYWWYLMMIRWYCIEAQSWTGLLKYGSLRFIVLGPRVKAVSPASL